MACKDLSQIRQIQIEAVEEIINDFYRLESDTQ